MRCRIAGKVRALWTSQQPTRVYAGVRFYAKRDANYPRIRFYKNRHASFKIRRLNPSIPFQASTPLSRDDGEGNVSKQLAEATIASTSQHHAGLERPGKADLDHRDALYTPDRSPLRDSTDQAPKLDSDHDGLTVPDWQGGPNAAPPMEDGNVRVERRAAETDPNGERSSTKGTLPVRFYTYATRSSWIPFDRIVREAAQRPKDDRQRTWVTYGALGDKEEVRARPFNAYRESADTRLQRRFRSVEMMRKSALEDGQLNLAIGDLTSTDAAQLNDAGSGPLRQRNSYGGDVERPKITTDGAAKETTSDRRKGKSS